MARKVQTIEDVRRCAESDLFFFARLVNPLYLYGEIHKEVFRWLMKKNTPNQLLLLPRGHLKSHCLAVWVAWHLINHPESTVLYLSATSKLAEAQLSVIKNILGGKVCRRYWPDLVNPEEGRRRKWTNTEIELDHPKRLEEGVRDPSVIIAGLTTVTTGWHADVIVPDDIVVPDNAYTEDGRDKVAAAMSQMASILNTGGIIKACGTRYHPRDQYETWLKQTTPVFDENDEVVGEEHIWSIFERVVEVEGTFLWPRASRGDGKMFGFDRKELARISAMYSDRTQFYAQYYQDPNDPDSQRLTSSKFQYYDRRFLKRIDGRWYFKDTPLNIGASIDFAFSLGQRSDYTAIVVAGIDANDNIYLLDIDRFRTDKINVYFAHLMALHAKWSFRKLRAEVSVGQKVICEDLKDKFRKEGVTLSVEDYRPTGKNGAKEARIAAVLEPRYDDMRVWHYQGGYVPALEEELLLSRPAHDDIKDAFASIVEVLTKPAKAKQQPTVQAKMFSSRFGGVSFRRR